MKKRFSRVYLEITNICNKSCSFCPGTKRPRKMISEDEFLIVAKALRPVTDYLYLHVMGEPLCHPLLPRLIRLATELGFRCAITTNGSLLKKRGAELLDSGLYKANISIHSFEGKESAEYEKYLSECFDFADLASERGILTVLRLWNNGCDGGLNESTISHLKKRFPDGEWREGARGFRIRDKLHLEYGDRFEWPDQQAPLGDSGVYCYGLGDHIGVLSDGTVIPCCLDREGVISLGNIFEQDIISIIDGHRARAIREGFDKRCAVEELCRRCGYARRFK